MNYPITHVVVKNTRPPNHVATIGHLYPIQQQRDPETVFRTVVPDEDEEDIERWEDDGGAEEDETEVKVVKPRRGRRPKATVVAETK